MAFPQVVGYVPRQAVLAPRQEHMPHDFLERSDGRDTMPVTVRTWPQGGYIIVPDRQPPFPIIFATYAQALAYAATLATTPDTPVSSTVEAPHAPPVAEHARRAGLTPAQYNLLRAVREHPAYPAVTIAALAERLHIRHQSACRRVAHAVARGLLHRHPAATDRRLVLVSLTDTGAQTLDRVTRATSRETVMPPPPH
ncbi:MAG: MarR family transcriptional regulator [Chloroflexota bacterium]|nr:MarR family transcriptional regulator [Chloroflexota bacterium]